MNALTEAFRGSTVLVTGHTGFKGSWLALWLHELGARVIGYALAPSTNPNLFDLARCGEPIEHNVGDVRDGQTLDRLVARTRPDYVLHLAAQALVRLSYEQPADTFETNVIGTARVLDAVRRSGHSCAVVVVTSDKCYENREWLHGYREVDPMGGADPYSASKGCAELLASSYRRSFFSREDTVRLATARAGNVIGGGDWSLDRIIPDCIRALVAGEPIGVRNPHATRPWQHVLEPLGGYLWLAARLKAGDTRTIGAWNFGPPTASVCQVRHLADTIVEVWGEGSWKDMSDPDAPHEARLLALSWEKAYHVLGWQPVWDLAATLRHTVQWYRGWHEHRDARQMCLEQIERYMADAAERGLPWARGAADG